MSLAIEAFIVNVRVFCDWIESGDHDVRRVRQTLLALMQGIPYLIVNGLDRSSPADFPRRGNDIWTVDVARLTDLPLQYYRVVLNPLNLEEETTAIGDLCDDFADIYGELWHGLQAHDAGATIYAVTHWRDSYQFHWGLHACGAISVIEAFLRTQSDG